MPTYTLFDLQEYIRRVLALNFSEAVWITAEVAECNSSRGHFFLELVQKGTEAESDLVAQAQAVLWQRDYQRLRLAMGNVLDELLQEGRELRLQVRVDFHERYGLKLVLLDLDPEYTFGRIELQRRRSIEALRDLGLLEKNRELSLPRVLQNIAVISSEGAAGFQDFRSQLAQNAFGYRFECRFFSSSVQGERLESEMLTALNAVAAQADRFDCAVILRGGGARTDLAGFDRLELCKQAAQLPVPLLTGIGHDVDETVLDLVAWKSLKTPTAVADFLIQHNLFFENEIIRLGNLLQRSTQLHIHQQGLALTRLEGSAAWAVQGRLRFANQQLDAVETVLPEIVRRRLQHARLQLNQAETICAALHPDSALRRGFSISLKDGKIVTNAESLQTGDLLETRFRDGAVFSKVSRKK